MSREIERIVVGPDAITVHGEPEHDICQCGHAKAFHNTSFGCYKIITKHVIEAGRILRYQCECVQYVDITPPVKSGSRWNRFWHFILRLE